MDYIKFSIRLPKNLRSHLENEASSESRNLNQQLEAILKDRYKAHAPPSTTRAKTPMSIGAKRKTKAEA